MRLLRTRGSIFCINKFLPPKNYLFINILGIFFTRKTEEELELVPEGKIRHEKIHTRQMLECLIIPFYLIYILNYLINLFIYKDHFTAYEKILFEQEAKLAELYKNYKSKLFGWI